jgi:hypothetical protein
LNKENKNKKMMKEEIAKLIKIKIKCPKLYTVIIADFL